MDATLLLPSEGEHTREPVLLPVYTAPLIGSPLSSLAGQKRFWVNCCHHRTIDIELVRGSLQTGQGEAI